MSSFVQIFLLFSLFWVSPNTWESAPVDSLSNPQTIAEAVDYLNALIPNKEIAIIRRTTEEEFSVNAISSLGAFMKEEWKLYSEDSPLGNFFMRNDIFNPDEMAEIILICFWRRVNGHDMNVDRLIMDRMRYWDDVRANDKP